MNQTESAFNVCREAWRFVLPTAILGIVAVALGWWAVGIFLLVLSLYFIYFYRDPGRRVPGIPGSLVAPGDGKVVSVIEVPCEQMPGGRAQRVAVFLSVFNVHVQRMPHRCTVKAVDRRAGKFINALNEKCSEENERVTLWCENDEGAFGVRQIAGAIARRIVCDVKVGDTFERGERYGLIHFGSRLELFLPLTATVKVVPGQKVVGGETCMALLHEEDVRKGRPMSREAVGKLTPPPKEPVASGG